MSAANLLNALRASEDAYSCISSCGATVSRSDPPFSHHLEPPLCRPLHGADRLGFDEPLPRIVGKKCDAFGLPRCDGDGVEPERLPAVVEAVEQAKGMTVHMDRLGLVGWVSAGENDHTSTPDTEQWLALVYRRHGKIVLGD